MLTAAILSGNHIKMPLKNGDLDPTLHLIRRTAAETRYGSRPDLGAIDDIQRLPKTVQQSFVWRKLFLKHEVQQNIARNTILHQEWETQRSTNQNNKHTKT